VLSPRQLTAIYRRLKILRGGAAQADPKLLGHVEAALEQMRQLGLALVRGRGSSLENGPVLWGSEGESTMEPEGIFTAFPPLSSPDKSDEGLTLASPSFFGRRY
jgi:hypothetical protein